MEKNSDYEFGQIQLEGVLDESDANLYEKMIKTLTPNKLKRTAFKKKKKK